jgi:hypothetical protein
MIGFTQADRRQLQAPGMVLTVADDGSSILAWDKQKSIVHAVSFAPGKDGTLTAGRAASRISHYASVIAAGEEQVAVYAGEGVLQALQSAGDLRRGSIKLLRWPGRGLADQLNAVAGQ